MILDSFRLDSRVALVTGAARGIGAAIAVALAEAGADVALLDVLACEATAKAVTGAGCKVHTVTCDLQELDAARADAIVTEIGGTLGELDILVNNAGIIEHDSSVSHGVEDWSRVFQVNLTSAFLLSQAFAKQAAGRGGSIVNVCSLLSFQGGKLAPSYAAAETGMAGLTRALANEWAPLGINVNAIAPGYLETAMTADIRNDPERSATLISRIPAGRWGKPEDVAGAAVFLASDAAGYVNGAILPVDGGWLSR